MVIAIGVDIVQVLRICGVLRRQPRFVERVLHPTELITFHALGPARQGQFVAGAWAAKEALYKTLDAEDQAAFAFRDWYRFSEGRRPGIARVLQSPEVLPDEFLLSISHDNDMLVATVLRQRGRPDAQSR